MCELQGQVANGWDCTNMGDLPRTWIMVNCTTYGPPNYSGRSGGPYVFNQPCGKLGNLEVYPWKRYVGANMSTLVWGIHLWEEIIVFNDPIIRVMPIWRSHVELEQRWSNTIIHAGGHISLSLSLPPRVAQCPGRFLSTIGQYPNVSKSNLFYMLTSSNLSSWTWGMFHRFFYTDW